MEMFSVRPYSVRVGACAPCEDVLVGATTKKRSCGCGGSTLDARTGARRGGCSRCRDDLHARTGQASNTTPTNPPPTNPAPAPTAPSSTSSGSPVIGLALGAIGGAAGGFALSKYVFKQSNFWATLFGSGVGGTLAQALGGSLSASFVPSLLAAYGASRYVHGK